MAGNSNSLIAITTQGRGGRNPESLPRSNKSYTIYTRNSKYRCSECHTIIQYIPKRMIRAEHIECPYCHSVNTIVTISRSDTPTIRKHSDVRERILEIRKLLVSKPNFYSIKDISNILELPYPNTVYYVKQLPSDVTSKLANKRGRKPINA